MEELISLRSVDAVFWKVDASRSVLMDMRDEFSYRSEGYQFDKRFIHHQWDGYVRLFNPQTRLLHRGLTNRFARWAHKHRYSIERIGSKLDSVKPTREQIEKYLDGLVLHAAGKQIILRDFQREAIINSLLKRRGVVVSPTASGKSLIIYGILRFALDFGMLTKIALVVPKVGLVAQMINDFKDYSVLNGWDAEANCHGIVGGKDKDSSAPIYVTTWQSIVNLDEEYFAQFDGYLPDEAHTCKAKSMRFVSEAMSNAYFRIGTTGTNDQKNLMMIEALLGPDIPTISTRELIDRGDASHFRVKSIVMRYPQEDREMAYALREKDKRTAYGLERNFLYSRPKRNKLIVAICKQIKRGNTLVVFNKIEHGKLLYEMLREALPGRNVYYVAGSVDGDDREVIRTEINDDKGAVGVVSLQTFSTGVSIRNLHNLIFPIPMKAEITIKQTIGRMLRNADDGTAATCYDFADDLSCHGRSNYSLKHAEERLKIYHSDGHPVETLEINV